MEDFYIREPISTINGFETQYR